MCKLMQKGRRSLVLGMDRISMRVVVINVGTLFNDSILNTVSYVRRELGEGRAYQM